MGENTDSGIRWVPELMMPKLAFRFVSAPPPPPPTFLERVARRTFRSVKAAMVFTLWLFIALAGGVAVVAIGAPAPIASLVGVPIGLISATFCIELYQKWAN